MRKRRSDRDGATDEPVTEDVRALVKKAAGSIRKRLDEWPLVDALAEDGEFLEASDLLVSDDVPLEVVEQVSRSSNPIAQAMAHRALAHRETVSEDRLLWAFRRLTAAYAGELNFLLQAIERHAEPPVLARVLAKADDDWSWGWCLEVVSDFASRRVEAGEVPTVADFEQWIDGDDADTASAVAALVSVLPESTARDFESWRRHRGNREFFAKVGRIWQPREDGGAVTSVGGRDEVALAL